MPRPEIRVTGLADLRRDLRRAGDMENLRELREGLRDAADVVAQEARTRVPVRSGAARDSIRATAGGNTAYVKGGKARVPHYSWLDFGSRTPNRGNPRSVGPWSGTGAGPTGGRFIYPAIDAKEREVTAAVATALDIATRKVGF